MCNYVFGPIQFTYNILIVNFSNVLSEKWIAKFYEKIMQPWCLTVAKAEKMFCVPGLVLSVVSRGHGGTLIELNFNIPQSDFFAISAALSCTSGVKK